ncbi:DUF892 family protein [Pedobacter sp. P351]|uniref:YciE/YciF ferroxidase family protein n=1 Tax=Pedobacter superstes TaxID=3133441 RepID=UPI0030A0D180
MRAINTLNDLISYYLQSLLDTEMRWSEEMDAVLFEVWSPDLISLLIKYEGLSRNHLRILGETLEGFHNGECFKEGLAIDGLIEEMKEFIKITTDPQVKDAAILVFHQCVVHYKIALYGTVISYASILKIDEILTVISHLLEEEKTADNVFTHLAETKINPSARSPLLQ